jgi:hypothetical protein
MSSSNLKWWRFKQATYWSFRRMINCLRMSPDILTLAEFEKSIEEDQDLGVDTYGTPWQCWNAKCRIDPCGESFYSSKYVAVIYHCGSCGP